MFVLVAELSAISIERRKNMALLEISNQRCRICFEVVKDSVSLSTLENGKMLSEMLCCCAKLEINEHDGLPYRCCTNCKRDLIVAYNLFTRCQKSEAMFRNQLQGNKSPKRLFSTHNKLKEDPNKTEWEKEIVCVSIKEESGECSLDNIQDEKDNIDGLGEDYNVDDRTDEKRESEVDCDILEFQIDVQRKRSSMPKRCCKCNTRFESLDQAATHHTFHFHSRISDPKKIAARPYECNMCFKRYTKKRTLQFHHRGMYIEKPFKCNECEQDFISETELNSHKPTHVKGIDEKKYQLPKCCACYKQFDSEKSLQQHCVDIHFPESQTASYDKANAFMCPVCYRRYKTKRSLLNHKLKPYRNKQYQCAQCGRIFRDKCALSDHERRHQGEQPFICPVCTKPFAIKDSFRKHVKSHSIEDDHFKCETCGKGFKTKGNLKDHYITHSSDYRPMVCSLCPATFARKSCLKSHMRMHTGEKPFKCHICEASYAFSSDLKRHIMAHTGIKPYVCNICGKSYPRQDYLRKHLAAHNSIS